MRNRALRGLLFVALSGAVLRAEEKATEEPPAAEEEETFDPDLYPPTFIQEIVKKNPCKKGQRFEVKDVLFSTELIYRETTRPIPEKSRELVKRWTRKLNAESEAAAFTRELLIKSGETSWWMPVPNSLIPHLRQELKPGDEATLFMSLAGCADGRPLVAIEEYSVPYYEDLEEDADTYIT
ncbi:MAG: hypothetical protein HY078_08645 [Elusimicrobia bacterium]|nr:hypothetical protein [Elusimicrobiota bacterium]